MKILVTGAGGLIGSAVVAAGGSGVVGLPRTELDITDPDAMATALDTHRPGAVINAAAQANVNRAEVEPALSDAVNADAVALLAAQCAARGVRLVHISTDYVLDDPDRELTETLTPAPRSAYARGKLAGEQAALRLGATVVRVQWVYAPGTRGFFNLALSRLAEGKSLSVVTDQIGRPTPASLVARGLLLAARQGPAGLFHLACTGEASAWDWIAAASRIRGLPMTATPTTRARLGGAHRPARSCLCSDRFAEAFGLRLPDWRAALGAAMAEPQALLPEPSVSRTS
jgi:dTDP-4-dehydrorhamnose reductase